MNTENDDFLNRWNSVKEEISKLEKKLENYKKYATKEMDKNGINVLMILKVSSLIATLQRYAKNLQLN